MTFLDYPREITFGTAIYITWWALCHLNKKKLLRSLSQSPIKAVHPLHKAEMLGFAQETWADLRAPRGWRTSQLSWAAPQKQSCCSHDVLPSSTHTASTLGPNAHQKMQTWPKVLCFWSHWDEEKVNWIWEHCNKLLSFASRGKHAILSCWVERQKWMLLSD